MANRLTEVIYEDMLFEDSGKTQLLTGDSRILIKNSLFKLNPGTKGLVLTENSHARI
jgi:hypothetical protein